MDKMVKYRQWIQQLLADYHQTGSENDAKTKNIEEYVSFDTERDHYQILSLGWENNKRIYYCILHLDIKNGKIWLQENNTDYDIIEELLERGVPKSDIVIGFHPTDMRSLTEFAVA